MYQTQLRYLPIVIEGARNYTTPSLSPLGKEYGRRAHHPDKLALSLLRTRRGVGFWRLLIGLEHTGERINAPNTLERLREARPDLYAVRIIANASCDMAQRYIAAIRKGDRKMVRIPPDAVRKCDFRRKPLTPMADGRSRWE